MARGHTIAERHNQAEARAASVQKTLRNYVPEPQVDISMLAQDFERSFAPYLIRDMSTFRPLRTKDRGRLRLAVAEHLCGKFSTPKVLKRIWDYNSDLRHVTNRWGQQARVRLTTAEDRLRQQMFVIVASGGSLHKELTSIVLTKKETHAFLNCPIDLDFEETLAYAIAGSYTSDYGVRLRIAKSKIKRYFDSFDRIDKINVTFLKEFIRFACVNGISIEEIDDILDYFGRGQHAADFSFKGRTIESVRKIVDDWHRALAREKRLGAKKWDGIPVADFTYAEKKKGNQDDTWTITQIVTSKALADEGTQMRHCVYSYQQHCIRGTLSIWSLKLNGERKLTIEVNHRTERIVQVRGYANRSPYGFEENIVAKWAAENRIGY